MGNACTPPISPQGSMPGQKGLDPPRGISMRRFVQKDGIPLPKT